MYGVNANQSGAPRLRRIEWFKGRPLWLALRTCAGHAGHRMRVAMRSNNFFVYSIVVFALALRIASGPTANMSYFILALLALFGRQAAIQALALCWLFTMLSSGIAPPASLGGVGRYAIILAAFLSVFGRYHARNYSPPQKKLIMLTIAMGIFFLLHSLALSKVVDVSVLKVVSWTVTTVTLFAAWGSLTAGQSEQLMRQLFSGLTLILLASVPLAALPIGYMNNGTGFQGILNQPQAFGPTMALLGVWSAMGMLTASRPTLRALLLSGACLTAVFMSEARTAGLALILGLIVSVVGSATVSRRPVVKLFPGLRSSRVRVLGVLALSAFVGFTLLGGVDTFLAKRGGTSNVVDAYQLSRGGLMEKMQENIKQSPFTGVGFGIASIPSEMTVLRDPIFNIPIGASVEKGVMPLAILEEVGVFGALFFLFWLWFVFRLALARGGKAVGLLFTIILLNFGEAVLFSVGGLGLLPLVLLTSIVSRQSREQERNGA